MLKNEWISTIEALRVAVRARDELNAALLEDNVRLKRQLTTAYDAIHNWINQYGSLKKRLLNIYKIAYIERARATYEKYKHLDTLLSDKTWIDGDDTSPLRTCTYDLWQAIRSVGEK